MAPLKLTYASCKYDRIEALRSGEVQVEGIDLNVIVFPSGRQIFDRTIGGQEFDASELSASEFIARLAVETCVLDCHGGAGRQYLGQFEIRLGKSAPGVGDRHRDDAEDLPASEHRHADV